MSKSENQEAVKRNSPNRGLIISIGVIFLAVTLVVIFSSTRSAVTLDRSTPAGTVQAFLQAALQGKNLEAAKFFAPNSGCDVHALDRAYVISTARVDLANVTTDGDTAQVRVKVEIPNGAPFENFMTEEHAFSLVNTNGTWLLDGVPWPLYDCVVPIK